MVTKVKERKRGRNKKNSQAEKLLTILLSGEEVTLEEVTNTLDRQIQVYRLSTYLWNLSKLGAKIKKTKVGRKLNTLQLTNVDEMKAYVGDRLEEFATRKPKRVSQEVVLVAAAPPKEVETLNQEEIADPNEAPPSMIYDRYEENPESF